MSEEKQRPIIIKRIIKKQAHHGGAWKIAYADFVTAMMAFFMLMWLLSMLNKYQLQGISNYFKKPLKEVFVQNQKNDIETPKTPDEKTKRYKLSVAPKAEPVEQQAAAKKIKAQQKAKEIAEMQQLKKQLEKDMADDPEAKKFAEQLDFEVVKDGLRIRLSDLEGKPMFSLGKTDFDVHAHKIIKWLSKELNKTSQKITILGYTDAKPYQQETGYSNWELSTDRANATRRYLVINGVDENRVVRIQGSGDVNLLDKKNGENPMNRRIEIILLNKKATQKMMSN